VAYGIEGDVATVNGTDIEVDVEFSGSIGAVKLEDATTTDRAKVRDGDAAAAASDHVLVVQHMDAAGGIPPAGDVNTNAPFTQLTDGSEDLDLKRADTAPTTATIVVPTQHVDEAGKVQPAGEDAASAITMMMLGQLMGMTGDGIYKSGIHFTAVQNAATEIDISGGFPAITDVGQFLGVAQISNVGAVTIFYPHQNVFSWDAANSRLTVTGATFAGTDTFVVVIDGKNRYASDPGNHGLMAEVSPYPLRADSAGIELITAAQDFTAAWADLGPEIPMFGYNKLKLWLTFDINDSTDLRVRVLEKHESGGVEEYEPIIETYSASDIKFEAGYWELNVDADVLHPLVYKGDGCTPYVQAQIMAGTLGVGVDAQIDAAYYTRSCFGG